MILSYRSFKSALNCAIIWADAIVAQLVEQLIRNEQVTGSIPANGSIFYSADCLTVRFFVVVLCRVSLMVE